MAAVSISPERKLALSPVVSPNGRRGQQGSASSTPNQHPYAIKTTSTAVLTRSNSSGYAASHQHVYIPSTPSAASRHRHSKSDLSRPSPRPLPIPPSLESPTKSRKGHGYALSEELVFPSVRARADTLPSISSPRLPSPVKVEELPSNPRVWTTSQLVSYLVTALRVKSGEVLPLPLPVAKDIAAFVKEARLNGRSFLRLSEQDLESMGINNLWREALLNASRNLRQNVLKGRIWGFEDDDIVEPSRVLPYRSSINSSSSSIDEAFGSQDSTPHKGADHKGRVRGLVASLERSLSSGSGFSNHGSSTSEGDVLPGAWADEEASFASGSEASEVEDRRARAVTKKRLFPEAIAPPADALQGPKFSSFSVSSPEEEPSVEELLTSGSMSGSWGAKAWEDTNIGETVKHIGIEHGSEDASGRDDIFAPTEDTSESGKYSDSRKGDARMQINDVFTRPLPSRPLPLPPKSEVDSPLIPAPPGSIVARIDRSVQSESEGSHSVSIQDRAQDVEATSADDSEKLLQALSLLEQYGQRLAELEKKISVLECKDAEQAQIGRRSQGIETDVLSAGADSVESRSFIPEQVQTGMANCALSNPTKSDGVQADCGANSTRSSQHSSTSAEYIDHSASPRVSGGPEWPGRRRFDTDDWDPLEDGLSSYVLMVGVGVCAVVLSTILKRLAGRKS